MPTFGLQIAAWVNKVGGDLDKVTRYCLSSVDGKLSHRSPVGDAKYWIHKPPAGYAGGRFKGNWQMSVGAPATGMTDAVDPGGQATLASHAGVIAAARAGQVFYLMNNLPYAKRIEEGWSRQAPIGLVALTVVEWNNIVDAAVNGVRSGTSDTDFSQGYKTYSI